MDAVAEPEGYPRHWEADVVLRDGSACHIRPIIPGDADKLRHFHSHLSPETIYYRYFAPYPELTEKDVKRFTEVDYVDRVAIVATVAGDIVGVGRYDRVGDVDAEVAFTVRDDYQGRGLGSVLLEHLAAVARERGVRRFVAEVLPQNRRMVGTFSHAGYRVAQELDEGVVKLAFEIEPSAQLRSVMQSREHRAEARSVERVLNPTSIAVVGASRRPETLGNSLLRNLVDAGFPGRLYPIHPTAGIVAGLPAYPKVSQAPGTVDLAVVLVPFESVPDVVDDCASAGVHALIVVSAGFSDAGPAGVGREKELVAAIREHGMRMVGPNSLGVVNSDPRANLNAALADSIPPRGRVALYGQSAALSVAALDRMAQRGLGLSTFVSTGNRADVSGHELLQYWVEDGQTSVVLLYLESIASPSKFIRVARMCTRRKPVVIVRSGRTSQSFPLGARPRRTELPAHAVDQLMRNAGVVEATSLGQLLDVGGVLACQPLPTGRRVTVIGDSHELVLLTADTCVTAGMEVVDQQVLREGRFPSVLSDALAEVTHADDCDAVIVVHVPPVRSDDLDVRTVLLDRAEHATVPIIAVLHTGEGGNSLVTRPGHPAQHGSVPYYGTVEEAVQSLRLVVEYADWRRRPAGEVPELPDVDSETARVIVADALTTSQSIGRTSTIPLVGSQLSDLLECYGITLWEAIPAASEDEAVAAADMVGWPVALKTLDPRMTRRGEFSGVRLNLENEAVLRAAYLSLAASLDETAISQIAVQRMAAPGVHCVIRSQEDPLFGPVLSFGLGGAVPELLGDRAYQVPPMSDRDAARLIRDPGAASVLFGYGGRDPADLVALEDVVLRVGRMADEIPELARLDLDPVIAAQNGLAVLGASAWLRPAEVREDMGARRLPDL